ncbi:MAG: hypothetical protein ACD_69C00319G0003 [uncultured bacterium]|nr:MAG: hypothetical protein ACD_69C00319G0003 [uncultured bacterium]OGT09657.1 MAG: potassium-transporting ATPase subunit C [Gammaproteobacteria bacterium RBG_16_37_9]HBC71707.1 potassium-transporting ATPase subunit C [Coxiellaceae bacterium]
MQKLITSIRVLFGFAILLGLGYPLFIVTISKAIFPYQANGSLLEYQGKKIGSSLIAQEFTSPKYFHSRFSAVNYNAEDSGGSNLAASNEKLYVQTKKHLRHIRAENEFEADLKIPADMVLSSASGLDPHISLDNAMLQLPRVEKHRHLDRAFIKRLIYDHLDRDFIGVWGQPGVNVLKLNLALDKLSS